MYLCVGEDLQDGQSDLHRICLTFVESIDLERKMVVFRTSPATTRDFLLIETRRCSRANISGTAHRISSKFKTPVPDLGRYTRSMTLLPGKSKKGKYFAFIWVLKNSTFFCPCMYARRSAATFDTPQLCLFK